MPNISQAVLYFMIYFKSQFLINFETIFYVYISNVTDNIDKILYYRLAFTYLWMHFNFFFY